MQQMMKTLAGMVFIVATLPLMGTAQAQEKPVEVKIGYAGPLTGAQSHYGKDMQNGIVLAIEDFNATHPMIGGKPVKFELDTQDDQADPRTGTMMAQKLVDDGIKGMLGHFNSGTTIPASRIYANAGIPQIAMATAAEYTEQGLKTAFRMMTSDKQQGAMAARFAQRDLGFKKIAVIDDRTAYGQGLADQFVKEIKKGSKTRNVTLLSREFASDKAVDFKAVLTKLKAEKPDLIYYGGAEAQAAQLAKQMKALGITATLMGGEMLKTPTFLKIAGNAAEGTIASLAGSQLTDMPGGKTYAQKYQKRFGQEVQTYSPYAYDGAMAMFTAMKNANSTDPAKYLPFLAKISMAGVTAPHIEYDAQGNLKNSGITMYKAEHGKWVPLKTLLK